MTGHPSSPEMTFAADKAEAIIGLLFLGVLIASALLWISHTDKTSRGSGRLTLVSVWPIGWTNFALFLCALIISVYFTQFFAFKAADTWFETTAEEPAAETVVPATNDMDHADASTETEPKLTPWLAVFSALTLQIPMLLTFYGLRAFDSSSFGGALNHQPVSLWKIISTTTPYFIRYLPIIWLVSGAWIGLLTVLQKLGIVDKFPPQQLIGILGSEESPVAVLLLAVFAVVLAPLVEEIIFRGAFYRFFKGQTSVLNAQIISGAFFAAIHFNLMSLLPLLLIGVLLARLYEKEGNILLPMLFHAYWNGFSLLMLFLTNQITTTETSMAYISWLHYLK